MAAPLKCFESACACVQILLEGAKCYPAWGEVVPSLFLSAEYLWQQLVPDFAALVRSLCTALEAWPPEVAQPEGLETEPGDLHVPLGLQYTVRASLSVAPRERMACLACLPPRN